MTLEGRGRLYDHAQGKVVLYLPAAVVNDSAFPFKSGEHVAVRIDGKRLIVQKEK